MAKKLYKNTYQRLNQDFAKNKHTPEVYYDGQNIRIVAHDRQSTAAVTNVRGNEYQLTIPDIEFVSSNADGTFTYRYQLTDNGIWRLFVTTKQFTWVKLSNIQCNGYIIIRNRIFLTTTPETNAAPTNSMGVIWEFVPGAKNPLILAIMDWFNFSTANPIESVGHYENELIQKGYWVDGYNEIRHANFADSDLKNLPIDFITMSPIVNQSKISLVKRLLGGGQFKAGRVAYCFNYTNQFGAQSKMSPTSISYNVNSSGSGDLVDDDIPVSFQLEINNVNTEYDYIRVYRIFWSLPNAIPVIDLIKNEPISSSTMSIIDDGGESISAISFDVWKFMGTDPFIPDTLGIKDNRLFTSNHKYKFFDLDFDFRAYRFNSSGDALIFKTNVQLSNPTTGAAIPGNGEIVNTSNWTQVDKSHDCINPSIKSEITTNGLVAITTELEDPAGNYWHESDPYLNQYIYTSDGVTIGAEGPNVSVTLNVVTTPEQLISGHLTTPSITDSFLNPKQSEKIGLKRDETYRVAIECTNNKGQWSFPIWICDFRMPSTDEIPLINNATGDFNQIQLNVEIKSAARTALAALGVTGYRIVRVERKSYERTIQAQGLFAPVVQGGNNKYAGLPLSPPPFLGFIGNWDGNVADTRYQYPFEDHIKTAVYCPTTADIYSSAFEFRSPDLNQDILPEGYMIVHTASLITNMYSIWEKSDGGYYDEPYPTWNDSGQNTHIQLDGAFIAKDCFCNTRARIIPYLESNYLNFASVENVIGKIVTNQGTSYSIANQFSFEHFPGKDVHSICNNGLYGLAGTTTINPLREQVSDVWTPANPGTSIKPADDNYFLIADFKRRLTNQYGGQTYADRTRNLYIPSSEYVRLSDSGILIVYGDTVTTNMRYQRSEVKVPNGFSSITKSSIRDMYCVPCEMLVNDDLRVTGNMTVSSSGTNKFTTLISEFHMYNPIYNYYDNINPKAVKPLDFKYSEHYDTEFRYSDAKLIGENFDAWTSFSQGNSNNASGMYGPVVKIIIQNDILFFFQHYGYGKWEVNPVKQVVAQDGSTLDLGTGDVLARYQYISTAVGCQHKWSISGNPFGVIWWDGINKKLLSLSNTPEELNMKGINTWLQNTREYKDNPLQQDGVNSIFYPKTNETFITFHTPAIDDAAATATTWVYSHVVNGFVGRFTTAPSLYIPTYGTLITVANDNRRIFEFDKGDRGSFDGLNNPAYITIIVNGDPDMVKDLTNLQWNSEAWDANGEPEQLLSITHIRVWNDYQDTGLVPLNKTNSSRFYRDWKFAVPIQGAFVKMRSQYHFVQLYLDNVDNREIVLQDLISVVNTQSL